MATVIITRPNTSIVQTTEVYKNAGLKVYQAPCFGVETSESVQSQWLHAAADVWIILSVHALEHALLIAPDLSPDKATQVLAVGPAVEKAWHKHFDHDISSHPWMNSEGVIELLKRYQPESVKILTTTGGRDLIKRHCMQAQISYTQINTYLRIPLNINLDELSQLYQNTAVKQVVLTATSSGILTQFLSQLSTDLQATILTQPLVVGAKRIADLAQKLGFIDIYQAASPSDESMCEAVMKVGV